LLAELPNADDPVEPAPGSRPEYTPLDDHYQIDINARPPTITESEWTLPITGLVDSPVSLTLADLQNNYEAMYQFVTLACISNRVGGDLTSTTLWTGASLQQVLADAGISPDATHIEVTSRDGFHESVALDLINSDERIMLAYHWDGKPLKHKHGFPLRIYIPDRYGMKQPKWIEAIDVIEGEAEGFWVVRGWDHDALMLNTSVIDTVAVDSAGGDPPLIPIGGMAHAGARGISKVEVRVNEGEWVEAALRTPLSDTTWTMWRYDWPFEEGRHVFEVRSTDGEGEVQTESVRSPRPSGATGIHSRSVDVA
jgi:DMSO/TMAO reductase YedYZ molybdopterin-dependent catalytic subunit